MACKLLHDVSFDGSVVTLDGVPVKGVVRFELIAEAACTTQVTLTLIVDNIDIVVEADVLEDKGLTSG